MKIIGHIYEEDNYDVFKRLPDNRDVLESRVNKLIASITERYICNPIIVNERMEIIDGQGRFEARKALGLPIHYIIVAGATAEDCRRMNKYNTSWTILDFAKSYAKKGLASYQLLLECCSKTKLSISTVLRLSNHGVHNNSKSSEMTMFERGELNFTTDDVNTVISVSSKAEDIIRALQFKGRVNEAFRTGMKVVCETSGYDHQRMVKNCEKNRSTYVQMSKLQDQLIEFERIYNNHARGRKLFFSDYMRNRGSNIRDYRNTRSPYDESDVSTLMVIK